MISFTYFTPLFISSLKNWKLYNKSTKQNPCRNQHSYFRVFTTWTFGTLAKPLISFWHRCRRLCSSYLVAIHFQFVSINSFTLYSLFYNFNFIHYFSSLFFFFYNLHNSACFCVYEVELRKGI